MTLSSRREAETGFATTPFALRRRGAARAAHTYSSKYGHKVYIWVYVYTLCQFDVWCVTVHMYFLTVYIYTNASNAGVRHGTPSQNGDRSAYLHLLPYSYQAIWWPRNNCGSSHVRARPVAFKIRSASAFKFKIVGLDAARSGSRGLIAAECSVVQVR
jgi:hypothetical protein